MYKKELFRKFDGKVFRGNTKILLISHNDMDGYGPEICLKKAFKSFDVQHVTNATMDNVILNTLSNDAASTYDYIIICDISCSESTADMIMASEFSDKYILLDHHKSAIALNKYPFCLIGSENAEDSFMVKFYNGLETTGHASGTSLMLDFLYYSNLLKEDEFLNTIAFTISSFDTWDWNNVFGGIDRTPYKLNQLFWALGGNRFVSGFDTKNVLFSDTDELILELENEKIDTYCRTRRSSIIETTRNIDGREYTCAFAFSTSYLTDFLDYMAEEFPNKDLYIVDTGSGYSLRSRKEDVDVARIASKYGGGGHTQAGGAKYDPNLHFERFKNFFI